MILKNPVQYVYSGQYAEFRGYVFAHGKPTTIQDAATADALSKREDFALWAPVPPAPPPRPLIRVRQRQAL